MAIESLFECVFGHSCVCHCFVFCGNMGLIYNRFLEAMAVKWAIVLGFFGAIAFSFIFTFLTLFLVVIDFCIVFRNVLFDVVEFAVIDFYCVSVEIFSEYVGFIKMTVD